MAGDDIEADWAEANHMMAENYHRIYYGGDPQPSDDDWFDAVMKASEGNTAQLVEAIREYPFTQWARWLLADLIARHRLARKTGGQEMAMWEKYDPILEAGTPLRETSGDEISRGCEPG